jgi:hypothetical protein
MITITQNQLSAIDAVHAASTTSDRYGFVSSRSIIDNLQTLRFQTRAIQVAPVRKEERQGFQKHIVRLRHSNLLPRVRDEFPEVVLINSHDGSLRLRMMLGWFVLVCSNGMVSGSIQDEINFVHRSINLDAINDGALRLVNSASRMADVVARMRDRKLTLPETASFVEEAVKIRYRKPDETAPIEDQMDWASRIRGAISARRYADAGSDLWSVFNRVQENLTQGRRGSGLKANLVAFQRPQCESRALEPRRNRTQLN